jgi:hypothetical protein
MCHINADPASIVGLFHPDVDPRVTGAVLYIARIKIARYISSRYTKRMATRDKKMAVILADPFT